MKIQNLLICSVLAVAMGMTSCDAPQNEKTEKQAPTDTLSAEPETNSLSIAFIYGDTINKRYNFLIDAQSELDAEEKRIQERVQRKLQRAEQRAAELNEQAPTMTQTQMQEAQLELQNLDLELQQFQEKLAKDFRKRERELQEEYLGRVNEYLDEFNDDGRYDFVLNFQPGGNLIWAKDAHDVTDNVLKGLNEKYDEELRADKENTENTP